MINLENLMQKSKSDMAVVISDTLEQLEDGYLDAIELSIFCKKLQYVADEILKKAKDEIDYTKLSVAYNLYDVEVIQKKLPTTYDFSKSNDMKWRDLSQTASETKEAIKEREAFLKTLKSETTLVDDDSGEIITLLPPQQKGGGVTVQFTLK